MRINQAVIFLDGPFAGKCAKVSIAGPFSQEMVISIGEHSYQVQRGPIAEYVEKTQQSLDHGVIRLALVANNEVEANHAY